MTQLRTSETFKQMETKVNSFMYKLLKINHNTKVMATAGTWTIRKK